MFKYKQYNNITEDELAVEIEKHNYYYWDLNNPIISDEAYDLLIQKLEELNPGHKLLQKIGSSKVVFTENIFLDEPMMSLEKTYFFQNAPKSKKSLFDWLNNNKRSNQEKYFIQPKYDGISTCYLNKTLITKGQQGIIGKNISNKIPIMNLETIGYKGSLSNFKNNIGIIRGEIIIKNNDYFKLKQCLNKLDGTSYKNQRNTVSGILNLKDISEVKRKNIIFTIIDYDLYAWEVQYCDFKNKWNSVIEKINKLQYPIDGVVIKLADIKYSKSLGHTAHHPRGQIAFKFSGTTKETILLDVKWSFGKNCLTPIAKIDPVEIKGVVISNITLHNVSIVEKSNLKIGDILTIERAGDVIPHVINSRPGNNRKSFMIKDCPCCGIELIRDNKVLKCVNFDCFEIKLQRFLYSIKIWDIEGIGENNLRKIMSKLNLRQFEEIFKINIKDLLLIDGFQQKMAENIYNSIWERKEIKDFKLLAALNIQSIGIVMAEKILEDYCIDELINMSKDRLVSIPNVGYGIAEYLYIGIKNNLGLIKYLSSIFTIINTRSSKIPKKLFCLDIKNHLKIINNLDLCMNLLKINNYAQVKFVKFCHNYYLSENIDLVIVDNLKNKSLFYNKYKEINCNVLTIKDCVDLFSKKNKDSDNDNFINKKRICFTGKYKNNKLFYKHIAEKIGYIVIDNVKHNLNLLITDSLTSNSSKMQKAKKYGIDTLTMEEWLNTLPKNI